MDVQRVPEAMERGAQAIHRLARPEAVQYQQIVVLGARRSVREHSQLKD
ncbi:MAG: hypothetical protein ABSH05_06975 [Bryobacteraceae bacterium]|jgi:hypothetical protein